MAYILTARTDFFRILLESDESLWAAGLAFKQAAATPHNEVQPVVAM
jgi:hypothetical protein